MSLLYFPGVVET